MQITGLGHAGLLIDTEFGRILCDPWLHPAFLSSWLPFPDNRGLDWDDIGKADYLFISHMHADHFDPELLKDRVSKRATVILPCFPLSEMRDALAAIGFRHFINAVSGEIVERDGLTFMVHTVVSPTDGPIGDSALLVSDGQATLLNQNDARLPSVESFKRFGMIDAHLLQFSGAIWYPMCYRLPKMSKERLGRLKRARQFDRAMTAIAAVGARWVFPIAGPPCFLDPGLWDLNDFDNQPHNIFADQHWFLSLMAERGLEHGRMLLPNSSANLDRGQCVMTHQIDPLEVFGNKRQYLLRYQAEMLPLLRKFDTELTPICGDPLAAANDLFGPILQASRRIRKKIGGCVRLLGQHDSGHLDIVLDFINGEVRRYSDEKCNYEFYISRPILEHLIATREPNWTDTLFLSMRFEVCRYGGYNEWLYAFFRCLSLERIKFADSWLQRAESGDDEFEVGPWIVQRWCPHLGADLIRFARVEGRVLTCTMHGWQWSLEDGSCLTADEPRLRTRVQIEQPSVGNLVE